MKKNTLNGLIKESVIINFMGGPGVGKSTQSAGLFTEMKKHHMDVEITFEVAKMIAWEENFSAVKDQFYITANQHRNISRLFGKVEYIIVDSPIILGTIYKDIYNTIPEYPSMFYDSSFDDFLMSLFKKYVSLNIFLKRDDTSYNEKGRFQTLHESKIIDEMIMKKLIEHEIPFIEFEINKQTSSNIFDYIKKNKI